MFPVGPSRQRNRGRGFAFNRGAKIPPSLLLPFAGATSLDSRITYTGSNGTYFNSSGVLTAATTNVARFDYDPSTLAAIGLLREEARTNLIIRSEEFDNASWTKTDTTITANSIASPDGTTTADLFTEGSAGTASVVQTVTATANANYAISRFFKRGNTDWVEMHLADGISTVRQWFNLNTRTVGSNSVSGTGAFVSASVQQLPNGWMRATLVGSLGGGTTAISATTISASADGSTTRVSNSTRYEWGAQFENNVSFATSYIQTVGAAVTRAADLVSMTGTNFSSWYNQSQGTFVVNYALVQPANGSNQFVVRASDNSYNNSVAINTDATGFPAVVTASGGVFDGDATAAATLTANTFSRVAGAYASNNLGISKDGATVVTDTSATIPVTLTRLDIGGDHAGANHFGSGWIQSIAYYPQRLPDSTLRALSV